ncbi:hypothetical protein GLYMA_07G151900v4 [Glycine max]|nr:hypothetical protein GLYMA_07G151900v4 [Glycine max]KAH1086977.1 hypothetical protein GYH30_018482 [Glycine max]
MCSMLKVFAVIELVLLIVYPGAHGLSRDDFPPGFVFGASTSAYQVEGAANEDGRKPSIWDTFSQAGNGNMYAGNGDVACDQYHKYKEDVQLMADMGLEAYRFSISWSRVIPDGRGQVNPKGLQYYNNLINELISHGIEAHVTLHHWDLPQTLEDEYGGWVSPRIVKDFTTYADVCFREFGDRVRYWTTVNEANVYAVFGYDVGMLPPQRCSPSPIFNCSRGNSTTEPYLVAHHMLLAHASAVRLYRKKYQVMQHGLIGFNLLPFGVLPRTNSIEDVRATQRVQDFFIGCPGSLQKEDRDYIADLSVEIERFVPNDTSTYEVPITTKIFLGLLESLKNTYGNIPIYIHENGQQTPHNSSLDDWPRVNYLHEYIGSLVDALRSGLNVKGYFVWSFLDAFELLLGYESSYGLYYVDMNDPSLRRIPKLSAEWYSNFLKRKPMDPKITKEIEKNATLLSHNLSLHNAT